MKRRSGTSPLPAKAHHFSGSSRRPHFFSPMPTRALRAPVRKKALPQGSRGLMPKERSHRANSFRFCPNGYFLWNIWRLSSTGAGMKQRRQRLRFQIFLRERLQGTGAEGACAPLFTASRMAIEAAAMPKVAVTTMPEPYPEQASPAVVSMLQASSPRGFLTGSAE